MQGKYTGSSPRELREIFLNDAIDANSFDMNDYERLFAYEMEFDDPNGDVLSFCATGLNQYEKYRANFQKPPLEKIIHKHNQQLFKNLYISDRYKHNTHSTNRNNANRTFKHKKIAVAVFAIFASLLLATVVAAAMGYNILDLVRTALSSPDRTAVNSRGDEVSISDDFRYYNSMAEMIEIENLDILFPAKLPDGYEFTEFIVADFGNHMEVIAITAEPYIEFKVEIGESFQIERYQYKTNGIEYNIVERDDGMYQAFWNNGKNYYWIIIGDRAMLPEIIENLKEN